MDVLLICLDRITGVAEGTHGMYIVMFMNLRDVVQRFHRTKKRCSQLLVHSLVGSVFGDQVGLSFLLKTFGFSKTGSNSIIPKLQQFRREILSGSRFSFERDDLYENSGQYDERIDEMIRSFWISDDCSVETPGVKRRWYNPDSETYEMKVVRVILFPTRLELWEKFKQLYGDQCASISRARGHKKRLIPSPDYLWSLKPNFVV